MDLKQLFTSQVAILPNSFGKAALGGVGRLEQEGGCELLLGGEVGGLSAEFAELHFSVSHRNSGGGGCVGRWAGQIMLACDYALPLC